MDYLETGEETNSLASLKITKRHFMYWFTTSGTPTTGTPTTGTPTTGTITNVAVFVRL